MEDRDENISTVSMAIKEHALGWMDHAPVTWGQLVEDLPINQREATLYELEGWLANLSIRAARLGGYIDARRQGQDHSKAVVSSNRQTAKVRKAWGFTLAKDDLSF